MFSDRHTVDYKSFIQNVVSLNFSHFSAVPVEIQSRNPTDSGGLDDLVIHCVADGQVSSPDHIPLNSTCLGFGI